MKILTTLMVAFSLTAPQPDPDWGMQAAHEAPTSRTEEMASFFERGGSVAAFDDKMAKYYSLVIMNHEADTMMLSIAPIIEKARQERAKAAELAANQCDYLNEASADVRSFFCSDNEKPKPAIRKLQHPEFL